MAPAFKEWQVIIGALRSGAQTLILRKGGIAEGKGGFQVRAERFWLFPTAFHAQREKTKPGAAAWHPPALSSPDMKLECFAEVQRAIFLDDWARVAALDPFHFWTEATVRERFDWSRPPGLHAFIVRVHRLREPIAFTPTAEMAGCKSWVDLPYAFADHAASPALDDATFAERVRAIGI